MKNIRAFFLSILLCLSALSVFGQKDELYISTDSSDATIYTNSIFDELYSDSVIALKLELDIDQFLKDKKEGTYQTASVTFQNKNKDQCSMPARLKARGKSRLKFCKFPPIKLKFDKDSLAAKQLSEHNDIKVVTHCREDIQFRNVVLKEYLVYKILNILTDQSLRVQLAKITYKDTGLDPKDKEYFGLLLEDANQLAARMNGAILEQRGLRAKYVAPKELLFTAMFQYMIGNTDWIIDKQHNLKYVKTNDGDFLKLILYDFDICGFVDAVYAIPSPRLELTSVKERLYLGECATDEEYQNCLDTFRKHKVEILNLVDNFDLLNKSSRKDMKRYLESFYKELDNPSFIKKKIRRFCKEREKE